MTFSRVFILGLLVATGGLLLPVTADDTPSRRLDEAVRELEAKVRAIHAARLAAVRERDRSAETVTRLEAEARDLEREAAASETESSVLRASVSRLARDRDDLLARESAAKASRAALVAVVASASPTATGSLAERFAEAARRVDARREAARSWGLDASGALDLGALGRFPADSDVARAVKDGATVRAQVSIPEPDR
jgi:hypothetical protein